MEYTRLETDYDTGEVFRISIGEHLPFTETAKKLEVSRLTLGKAMLEGDLCQREYDEVAKKDRIRLHPEAVEKGLGFRIMGERGPFDVLSLVGIEVAEGMLQSYLLSISPDQWRHVFEALKDFEADRQKRGIDPLSAKKRSSWIAYHFGEIPIEILAGGIGVCSSLVYRHKRIREARIKKLQRDQHRVLPDKTRLYGYASIFSQDSVTPYCLGFITQL